MIDRPLRRDMPTQLEHVRCVVCRAIIGMRGWQVEVKGAVISTCGSHYCRAVAARPLRTWTLELLDGAGKTVGSIHGAIHAIDLEIARSLGLPADYFATVKGIA